MKFNFYQNGGARRFAAAAVFVWLVFIGGCDSRPAVARGYENAAWGSSPDAVRKTYELPEEIQLRVVNEDNSSGLYKAGDRVFLQSDVSEKIKSRIFFFRDNKLFLVFVTYSDTVNTDGLLQTLTEKYGDGKKTSKTETITETDTEIIMPESQATWNSTTGRWDNYGVYSPMKFKPVKKTKLLTTWNSQFLKYLPDMFVYLEYDGKEATVIYTCDTDVIKVFHDESEVEL